VSRRAIIINSVDNVATALEDIESGEQVDARLGRETRTLEAEERIPFGFKVALMDIPVGEPIIKYGETIGIASAEIGKGCLVHVHNVEGTRGRGDLAEGE